MEKKSKTKRTKKDFGVDLSTLRTNYSSHIKHPVVDGRIVHIDADFIAYQVSGSEKKTFQEMKENVGIVIDKLLDISGSESYLLHLTDHKSDKGNRYNLALLKEYQADRKGRIRPKLLKQVKQYMQEYHGAVSCLDMEADDSMSIAQYEAIANGTPELSVIASADKDLCMVPGVHLNTGTHMLSTLHDPYGFIELVQKENAAGTKKIVGRGWKFFWSQMLTGDTADNISGLPKLIRENRRPKLCGAVTAYEVLDSIESNLEAYETVRDLYKAYGKSIGFQNYRDKSEIKWGEAFISEAKLLWMRRENNENDVINWMKEIVNE